MHRQGAARKKGADGEAQATGPNPTDRGKSGSKRHLLTDGRGVPLGVVLSGANRHDMKKLGDLLEAVIRPVPEALPGEGPNLCLDRGYAYAACRQTAQAKGYTLHIPPRASQQVPLPAADNPKRHPPRRWVVEACHSWFNRFRRLLVRWEKRADRYLGFVHLAARLVVYRKLKSLLSG